MGKDNRVPSAKCPGCGHELTAAFDMEGEAEPEIGDVTVCMYCSTVLTFTVGWGLRLATAEDKRAAGIEHVEHVRSMLTRFRREVSN